MQILCEGIKMKRCIEVNNLTKEFFIFDRDYKIIPWLFSGRGNSSTKTVLKELSFHIDEGETVGLIGINGAGKSTLMKIIAGITYATSGSVKVEGRVGSLINLSAGFNQDYTGRKNIYYKGALMGLDEAAVDAIIEDVAEFVELGEYFDRPLRMYSSGMSARLGFALAVFSNPDILIVDEVFAVGDKVFKEKSKAKTLELFNNGKSVLFSSHSDALIKEFCNRVLYIKDGKIAFDGDVEEGLKRYNEDIKNRRVSKGKKD